MDYLLRKLKSFTSLISKKTPNLSPPSQTPPVPLLSNHPSPSTFTLNLIASSHPRFYTITVIDPEKQQVYSTTTNQHYLKEVFRPSAYPHPNLSPMTPEKCTMILAGLLPDLIYHLTIKTRPEEKQKTNIQNWKIMPPTCNSYSHSWHTLPRYNPLFIYKYSWLIETTHDFQEHAATIKDNPQLSNDIYFLDHINQTIWWMEKAAIHQRMSHPNPFRPNDRKWTWTENCPYSRIAILQTISSPSPILFPMPQHLQLPFRLPHPLLNHSDRSTTQLS